MNNDKQCERCGEVNPAEIHTCTPKQAYPDNFIDALRYHTAINEQPEPDPVAWVDKAGAVIPHSHKLFKPDIFTDYTTPLYTAPPQRQQRTYTLRKWQGLTDKEREEIAVIAGYDPLRMTVYEYRVAIQIATEAKLKAKNG
jgi:hypothetical protein